MSAGLLLCNIYNVCNKCKVVVAALFSTQSERTHLRDAQRLPRSSWHHQWMENPVARVRRDDRQIVRS